MESLDGMVLVDKPGGISSRQALSKVRRMLGVSKAGYLGTLDPLATGLLVCFLGSGTKMIRHFEGLDKIYEVTFELGKRSDSFDVTGQVEEVVDTWKQLTNVDLVKAVADKVGAQWQIQPRFSALKRYGRRAYSLVREGKEFDLGKRRVTVHRAEVLQIEFPLVRVRLSCGSGTYVRSWVHELGEDLRCGAIVTAIRRTHVGTWWVGLGVAPEGATTQDVLSVDLIRKRHLAHIK